ncbi:MAG: glycosyltransferase [Armatimonadota bacterium]|nr:glycosyltransferase [Armatimonadota bacterium]MDR7469334.1 glycosyltransferase [Armatimonadota bacterium]MDR7539248.1 glycosyltransferase [Armatimonadota bacterium]
MEPQPDRLPSRIRQAAMLLALAAGVVYLVWRLFFTLNTQALWLALPVWAAELYGVAAAGLLFFTAWRPTRRSAPPALPGRSVDVLIVVRDEPPWMVRRAVLGALALRYPHATWVLDAGGRPEVAQMAGEFGCRYLAAAGGSRAETLNRALADSHAEFVAVFDADQVSAPEFLDRTLGYFADPRVAFVQTSQDFYNVDSYQHRFDVESRRTWHDQVLFFRVIQPGKDRWNAALYTGTCAVLRRSALEDAGGFAPEVVAEGLHTSLRLHGRGWRSVYHNEVLAYGLAAVAAGPYHAQRLRWDRGAMQLLRCANPLTVRGLSLPQRLSYLATLTAPLEGWQKLVFYLTPPVYLFTGILPVRALEAALLARLGLVYGLLLLAYKLACRGHGMALLNAHYSMVRFYTSIKSTAALLRRARGQEEFRPPVASDRPPWPVLLPVLFVFTTNDLAVYAGTTRFVLGVDPDPLGYAGNLLWASWHVWLTIWAVWFALKKVERRARYRLPVAVPVRYAGEQGDTGIGVLVDIHEEGAGLLVPQVPFEAKQVWVQFLWFDQRVGLDGEVVFQRETPNGLHVGLRLRGLRPETRDFLTSFVILFAQRKFVAEVSRPMDRLGAAAWRRERRRTPRRRWHLPVRVEVDGDEVWGVTQDVSERGALVLFPQPLAVGSTFRLAAWTSRVAHTATVVHSEVIELPPYTLYRAGLRITPAPLGAPVRRASPPQVRTRA